MTSDRIKTNVCPKIIFTALLCLTVISAKPVFAQTPPTATCITPTGEKIVTYLEGTHGIPGNPTPFTGKDEVFNLGNDDSLQCFCATTGSGVETIWWSSFEGLSQAEIDNLISQGWIFVPDGTVWGLAAKPYLAKNTNYTCSGTTTTTSSSNPSGPSQPSTPGQVLGVSTLAQTGGKGLITLLLYIAATSVILGILLKILTKTRFEN